MAFSHNRPLRPSHPRAFARPLVASGGGQVLRWTLFYEWNFARFRDEAGMITNAIVANVSRWPHGYCKVDAALGRARQGEGFDPIRVVPDGYPVPQRERATVGIDRKHAHRVFSLACADQKAAE